VPWTIILPLVLLAILLVALVFFVQRASKALATVRRVEGYQRAAADLAARMDGALSSVIVRVDAVRRHQLDAPEIITEVDEALVVMEGFLTEAQAIRAPVELAESQAMIERDLERGLRALEMIGHGALMASGHVGRAAELEAQTSIKRGYLNLLHARDAVVEHATDLAEARDASQRKWRTSRI
jgi:hypothetical protein